MNITDLEFEQSLPLDAAASANILGGRAASTYANATAGEDFATATAIAIARGDYTRTRTSTRSGIKKSRRGTFTKAMAKSSASAVSGREVERSYSRAYDRHFS